MARSISHAEGQSLAECHQCGIRACERGGQRQAALTLFEAMPKAKVEPDIISYNAASSACEKVGQ